MEKLLHYIWHHRLWTHLQFVTEGHESVEVIDVGTYNSHAGPDFFNAKVKIDGQLWAGSIEIHINSSDWYRHHHDTDKKYNNVVLHVVQHIDRQVFTQDKRELPQVVLTVPDYVKENYEALLKTEFYPPCYRIIPQLSQLYVHSWMNALTVERLMRKTQRIQSVLNSVNGDWERTFFVTLARNVGFGVNSDVFERWARELDLVKVGHHRDNLLQVEAFFLGTAGLLEENAIPAHYRDTHYYNIREEFRFLQTKFHLQPMNDASWKYLRMRPGNFPHVRLLQLAKVYSEQKLSFNDLLETHGAKGFRALLKKSGFTSANLLIINTIVPVLFAYGSLHHDEALCDEAYHLLEELRYERNYITQIWQTVGLRAENAADSQALLELRLNYCDKRDCLRCRFGAEFMRTTQKVYHQSCQSLS